MSPLLLALALATGASGNPSANANAIERLAEELDAQIAAAKLEAPVGVYVENAVSAPLGRAFRSLVVSRLARRRLAPVVVDARDATRSELIARERGLRSLVRLTVVADGTTLAARGDAIGTWVNFWSGRMETRSGPAAALAASTELDAHALALSGATPPTPTPNEGALDLKLAVLARLPAVPAAVLTGDLDGDGRPEVVALADETVLVFNALGKPMAKYELAAEASPTPGREPFGLLALSTKPPRLTVWSARRAQAEVLEWREGRLKPVGRAAKVVADPLTVELDASKSRLTAPSAPQGLFGVSRQGDAALVLLPGGRASLQRGRAEGASFGAIGSGSTLADVDGDTLPEVVATTARTSGDVDELRVVALGAVEAVQTRGGQLPEAATRWQATLPQGRVLNAAAADLDGAPGDEVVLGVWRADGTGELLLLGRALP